MSRSPRQSFHVYPWPWPCCGPYRLWGPLTGVWLGLPMENACSLPPQQQHFTAQPPRTSLPQPSFHPETPGYGANRTARHLARQCGFLLQSLDTSSPMGQS